MVVIPVPDDVPADEPIGFAFGSLACMPPPVALPSTAAEPVRAASAPVAEVSASLAPVFSSPLLMFDVAAPPPVALPPTAALPVRSGLLPVVLVVTSLAASAGPAISTAAKLAVVMNLRIV